MPYHVPAGGEGAALMLFDYWWWWLACVAYAILWGAVVDTLVAGQPKEDEEDV